MRHGYIILNQSVNVLTRVLATKMPYGQVLLRDSAGSRKYCMYFFLQGSTYTITCSKGQNRHRILQEKTKTQGRQGHPKMNCFSIKQTNM